MDIGADELRVVRTEILGINLIVKMQTLTPSYICSIFATSELSRLLWRAILNSYEVYFAYAGIMSSEHDLKPIDLLLN